MCNISYIKYMNLLSIYTLKITNFISHSSENLCECKKKLIITTWVYLCNWYLENGIRLDLKSDADIKIELKKVMNNILRNLKTNGAEKNLVRYYEQTLKLNVEEIISALTHNRSKEDKKTNIYVVGELFLLFAKHSVLELVDLPISYICENTSCPERKRENSNKLIVFVTDVFQMNTFAIRKMKIISDFLDRDAKKEEVELDFTFVEKKNYEKIQRVLNVAKETFKFVKLTGLDKKHWEAESYDKKETLA